MRRASSGLADILASYDATLPLAEASTLPGAFYVDPRVHALEHEMFETNWHYAARADQVAEPGAFVTTQIGREPVLVVRGEDGVLRAFSNVCRHHAAEVMTGWGKAASLRCPYHGWTYALDGALRGVPEFQGVCNFRREESGLNVLDVDVWETFVFVRVARGGPTLREHLGSMLAQTSALGLSEMKFAERHEWTLDCNWKVFVDNYLDGGYHVPHLHRGLATVLDHTGYTIENGERHCLQWSPMRTGTSDEVNAVRRGDRAHYFWLFPNLMINVYSGVMDTNLVLPLGVDRTRVVFDFWFADVSDSAREKNAQSIAVGRRIQEEDVAVCESVQRGLGSRAYGAGRLSVRREAGEHLFHRLLHAEVKRVHG